MFADRFWRSETAYLHVFFHYFVPDRVIIGPQGVEAPDIDLGQWLPVRSIPEVLAEPDLLAWSSVQRLLESSLHFFVVVLAPLQTAHGRLALDVVDPLCEPHLRFDAAEVRLGRVLTAAPGRVALVGGALGRQRFMRGVLDEIIINLTIFLQLLLGFKFQRGGRRLDGPDELRR